MHAYDNQAMLAGFPATKPTRVEHRTVPTREAAWGSLLLILSWYWSGSRVGLPKHCDSGTTAVVLLTG